MQKNKSAISIVVISIFLGIIFFILPQKVNSLPNKSKLNIGNIVVPNTKAYVLQAPKPGDDMPRKECKGIGKDCKKNASALLTKDEWIKYFPEIKDPQKFGELDLNNYPKFIEYLQSIGFGME